MHLLAHGWRVNQNKHATMLTGTYQVQYMIYQNFLSNDSQYGARRRSHPKDCVPG